MECASEVVCQRRDKEICYLGWLLLFLWLVMVIYITKEIWTGVPLSTPVTSLNSLSRGVTTAETRLRKDATACENYDIELESK